MRKLVLCFLLVAMAALMPARSIAQSAAPDRRAAAIDTYVRACANAGTFMGAVLVATGDEVLFEKGYGRSDDAGSANGPRTRFRVGSITKSFTAAAVLKLQEAGKLALDDAVSKYLPGYPRGNDITIRHLLTHTSGIADYLYLGDAYLTMDRPTTLDELVASFSGVGLRRLPGERFSYSNSGYVLCTKIIEVVSGRSYADFIENELLRPAGMLRSGVRYEDDAANDGRARGYHFTGEGYVPVPHWDSSKAVGAGAIYGTAEDLLTWSRALFSGKVLRPASLAAMLEPTAESRRSYGMGWYRGNFLGRDRVYHGGYIFGFRSDLTIYPAEGVTIVVLSNVDTAATRRMAEDIAAILFGAPYEVPVFRTPAPVDPRVYPRYAGTYDTSEVFGPEATMTVFAQGDKLWYRSNTLYDSLGLPIYIYPESPSVFFDRTGTARYEFEVGIDGTAEAIVVSDGPESYRFPRLR